jgi:hypothetical protein
MATKADAAVKEIRLALEKLGLFTVAKRKGIVHRRAPVTQDILAHIPREQPDSQDFLEIFLDTFEFHLTRNNIWLRLRVLLVLKEGKVVPITPPSWSLKLVKSESPLEYEEIEDAGAICVKLGEIFPNADSPTSPIQACPNVLAQFKTRRFFSQRRLDHPTNGDDWFIDCIAVGRPQQKAATFCCATYVTNSTIEAKAKAETGKNTPRTIIAESVDNWPSKLMFALSQSGSPKAKQAASAFFGPAMESIPANIAFPFPLSLDEDSNQVVFHVTGFHLLITAQRVPASPKTPKAQVESKQPESQDVLQKSTRSNLSSDRTPLEALREIARLTGRPLIENTRPPIGVDNYDDDSD